MIGIYIITNEVNNKCYVGQVGKGKNTTFTTRWNSHINDLRKGKHYNSYLQTSWNKYGEDNFTFDVLEEVEDSKLLNDKEKYWITYYESNNNEYGYNLTAGCDGVSKGNIPWNKGKTDVYSEETKIKMGKANIGKGKPLSEEHKIKIGQANSGSNNGMHGKFGKNNPVNKMTLEMINDVNNGMKCSEFIEKYKISGQIYYKIRKGEYNVTNY